MGFAIAAGVLAAGATAYAAKSASDSSRDAQRTNVSQARQQRELEERLFHEGRGSAGHAILPEYLGDFEKQLGEDTVRGYKANLAFQGTPEEQLAKYRAITERYQPAFEQGSDVVDSIYSGAMQRARLAEAQPVMDARSALARTHRQGILDDIQARLGALDAANAAKGYVGSGSAAQGAALRQTLPFYQRAAGVGAQAALENAQQAQGIYDTQRDLQLRSLDLPGARAQQAFGLQQMPSEFLNQSAISRFAPFKFFQLEPDSLRVSPPPPVKAIPSTGQIIASSLGQVAGAAGNVYENSQLANQLNSMRQPPAQPAYNPWEYQGGAYDWSPVPMYGGGYG